MDKGRAAQDSEKLNMEELVALRSLIYKSTWVARKTRPDVSGAASVLGQLLTRAQDGQEGGETLEVDGAAGDKGLKHAVRRHLAHLGQRLRECGLRHGARPERSGGSGLASGDARAKSHLQAVPLSWRSSRCRRVVNSSLAGKTQAALASTTETEWIHIIRDTVHAMPAGRSFIQIRVPRPYFSRNEALSAHSLAIFRNGPRLACVC